MEGLEVLMNAAARVLASFGGLLAAGFIVYAGIQWMTAGGDPNKIAQARMSLVAIGVGLLLIGVAFIVPRMISELVIEPAGGIAIRSEAGLSCDGVLRAQLVFQRAAGRANHMQQVIQQIQTQRGECSLDAWDPVVKDPGSAYTSTAGCASATTTVGTTAIPSDLKSGNKIRSASGRDSDNNMIVHWDHDHRPTDGSKCWLYIDRLSTWDEEY